MFDKECFNFNYIPAILWYSIYKSYYMSGQKTKAIHVYSLFVKDLRSMLNVCEHIYSRYKSVLKSNHEKIYGDWRSSCCLLQFPEICTML